MLNVQIQTNLLVIIDPWTKYLRLEPDWFNGS